MEPLANARGSEGVSFRHRRLRSRDREAVPSQSLLFNRRDEGVVESS